MPKLVKYTTLDGNYIPSSRNTINTLDQPHTQDSVGAYVSVLACQKTTLAGGGGGGV